MAWETRHGRKYFYRKVRVGHQVRSIYVGSEETAGAVIRRHDERRCDDLARRMAFQRRKTDILATFAAVAAASHQIELLLWTTLLGQGYYRAANAKWRIRNGKKASHQNKDRDR